MAWTTCVGCSWCVQLLWPAAMCCGVWSPSACGRVLAGSSCLFAIVVAVARLLIAALPGIAADSSIVSGSKWLHQASHSMQTNCVCCVPASYQAQRAAQVRGHSQGPSKGKEGQPRGMTPGHLLTALLWYVTHIRVTVGVMALAGWTCSILYCMIVMCDDWSVGSVIPWLLP